MSGRVWLLLPYYPLKMCSVRWSNLLSIHTAARRFATSRSCGALWLPVASCCGLLTYLRICAVWILYFSWIFLSLIGFYSYINIWIICDNTWVFRKNRHLAAVCGILQRLAVFRQTLFAQLTAESPSTLEWAATFPSKLPIPMGICTPCNIWFLGLIVFHSPNDISIGSAVFAQLTAENS